MVQMNFNLEDGEPPVSFSLHTRGVARFVTFMRECYGSQKDAERYRLLRMEGEALPDVALYSGRALDDYIDAALAAKKAVKAPQRLRRVSELAGPNE